MPASGSGALGGRAPVGARVCVQGPNVPQVRWSIGGSQPLTIAISTISTRQASIPLPVLVCYQVRQRSPNCHQG